MNNIDDLIKSLQKRGYPIKFLAEKVRIDDLPIVRQTFYRYWKGDSDIAREKLRKALMQAFPDEKTVFREEDDPAAFYNKKRIEDLEKMLEEALLQNKELTQIVLNLSKKS